MFKKITIALVLFITIYTLGIAAVDAQMITAEDAQKKAEEIHNNVEKMRSTPDLVSPDSIYTGAELKAIYYQNIQIIELLGQIRNLLQMQVETEE